MHPTKIFSSTQLGIAVMCQRAINSACSTPNLRACTIGFSQSMCLRCACIISQHDTSRHLIARAILDARSITISDAPPNARPQSKQQYDRPTRSPIHASPHGSSRTPATPSISHYARSAHERLHAIVVISPHLSRRHCSPHSGREHSFAGKLLNCSRPPSTAVVYAKHHDFP